ncbi:uncharacterized protein DMENIID0001_169500 [Sergentomyia squamirostris]
MMVQYQPQWMHQTSSTAEGGVSAFVAGNSGSAGTVFHSPPPESDQESSSNVEESLTSAAEAYDPIPEVPDVPEATEVTEKSAKKVKVSLESAEVEADYDDDRQRPQRPHRPQRPPPPSSSASAPETDGNYFPVNFHGATSGAAIAIANSYSTGKGGSAVSHATAYGNPMIPKKTSRS